MDPNSHEQTSLSSFENPDELCCQSHIKFRMNRNPGSCWESRGLPVLPNPRVRLSWAFREMTWCLGSFCPSPMWWKQRQGSARFCLQAFTRAKGLAEDQVSASTFAGKPKAAVQLQLDTRPHCGTQTLLWMVRPHDGLSPPAGHCALMSSCGPQHQNTPWLLHFTLCPPAWQQPSVLVRTQGLGRLLRCQPLSMNNAGYQPDVHVALPAGRYVHVAALGSWSKHAAGRQMLRIAQAPWSEEGV